MAAPSTPPTAPRVLLIDNYDSFTYNLAQLFRELGAQVTVLRNDCIDAPRALTMEVSHLVVSPGPGSPKDAGASASIIEALSPRIPVLGVCLGHQVIAELFGAQVRRAEQLMHGKASTIAHDGRTLFAGLPSLFEAGRYHSLAVVEASVPPTLEISARTESGEIMGIRHRSRPTEGVQFHPESVLTPLGRRLLENFLRLPDAPPGSSAEPSP